MANKKDKKTVRTSTPIDLSDNRFVSFNIGDLFDFYPKELTIERVKGKDNQVYIHATLTEEELAKEKNGKN